MSCFRRGFTSLSASALLVAGLYGQAAPLAAPAKPAQTGSPSVTTDLKKKAYVRPFSFGVTLGVLAQSPMQNGGFGEQRTNYTQTASTVPGGYRIGFGVTGQVRLPKKYAVAASVLQYKSRHDSVIDIYEGIDNPNTPLDDRTHTTIEESSIVKYWDYTFTLRRYTKDHFAPGPRAFFGGGFNFRDIRNIRSARETTVGADTTADTKPITPPRTMGRGIVGSVGAQFVDDFGVKLVPEFRYTRWLNPVFDVGSQIQRKNQFEAMVSITF